MPHDSRKPLDQRAVQRRSEAARALAAAAETRCAEVWPDDDGPTPPGADERSVWGIGVHHG